MRWAQYGITPQHIHPKAKATLAAVDGVATVAAAVAAAVVAGPVDPKKGRNAKCEGKGTTMWTTGLLN